MGLDQYSKRSQNHKKYHVWQINDRTSLNIWNDRWFPNQNTNYTQTQSNIKMFSQQINHNTKSWDMPKLRSLFNRSQIEEITKSKISNNAIDKII